MNYLIQRQTIICKALSLLQVVIKDNPNKLLTKEETEALTDVAEKEMLKLVMLEQQIKEEKKEGKSK